MHHMDTDEAYREKAWRELQKNTKSYTEQVLKNISCTATYLPSLKTIQIR